MKYLVAVIVPIVAVVSWWSGYNSRIDPNAPIDSEGHTTITILFGDSGDDNWCELRGPARFMALDDIGVLVDGMAE